MKCKPVATDSRSGSRRWPVESPTTAALKWGSRPRLASAVRMLESPTPTNPNDGKRPVSYGSMSSSRANSSAPAPKNTPQKMASQRRQAGSRSAAEVVRGSELEVDEVIRLVATKLDQDAKAGHAERCRYPCQRAFAEVIAQFLCGRQTDCEQCSEPQYP